MNYVYEIACASVFTVLCVIYARFYSLLNRALTYWDKKKVNGPLPRYVVGTWIKFGEKAVSALLYAKRNKHNLHVKKMTKDLEKIKNKERETLKEFVGSEDYANALKYGKVWGTFDGLTPNLLVTDPELIKEILSASADKFQDFRFASESSVVLKDSLLSLSGGEKQETLMLTASLLAPSKLEKLLPKLESSAEILINSISAGRREDGLVDITSAVKEFIDEIIALSVFGIELNADVRFKDEFVEQTKQILRVKSPQSIWSILPYLYETYFKEAWVCPEKALQYFVNLIISRMEESSTEDIITEGKASNLVELLVEAANEEKKLVKKEKEEETPSLVLTDNAIFSKCIASMLTLANATRTTVLLGIYALASNEEVQEKLHKEVEKNKSEVFSYGNIQQLNYLDAVVKEVLRIYPFEFRLERVTTDKVKLGEIELNKQIRVSIPLYALHQLEEYYPEPQKFEPERFLQSQSETRNLYTYLPFGQAGFNGSDFSLQLAVLASKVTLFRLIEKFKFSTLQQLGLHRLFQKGFTRVPLPEKIEVFAEARV